MKLTTCAFMLSGAATFTYLLCPVYGAEIFNSVKMTSKANSDFCIDLYQELARENTGKNLFFSPFSISSALAMTAEGARGETATEMAKVLRYPQPNTTEDNKTKPVDWDLSQIHQGFHQINGALNEKQNDPKLTAKRVELQGLNNELRDLQIRINNESSAGEREIRKELSDREHLLVKRINELGPWVDQFKLNVANAIWVEKNYSVENDFREAIARFYTPDGLQLADFMQQPDPERLRINAWVETQTQDRIKNLIPADGLSNATRMVLVNAIYFKGEWLAPFNPARTMDSDFLLADGGKAKAKIMQAHHLGNGRYGAFEADGTFFKTPTEVPYDKNAQQPATYPSGDGFSMAELPYKGNELSMVLIAPMNPDGLPAIEKQLSSAKLDEWIGSLVPRQMNMRLPRFKLETDYQLGDTLQSMGMVRAFTSPMAANGADFTGIHQTDNLEERLLISQVIHKAFLEVNEKGTEAAAATAVMIESSAAYEEVITVPFIPTFKADRPFLLLIRHKPSGAILFMGRITKPS